MSAPPPPYNQPSYNQGYKPYGNQPPPPGMVYNVQPGVQPPIGQGVQPGYAVYYTQPQTVVIDDCHSHHHHHRRRHSGGGGGGEACCLAGLMACLCFMCLSK